jgi:hypothetical protein
LSANDTAMAALATNAGMMARLSSVNGAMTMMANPGFARAVTQMGSIGAASRD